MEYGSRVRRQGKSRAFSENQFNSLGTIAIIFGGCGINRHQIQVSCR
jgi:hypothetical protein